MCVIDGSFPSDRMERYGNVDEAWGENLVFGGEIAAQVMEKIIVSDGAKGRGQRKTLFSSLYTVCGVAAAEHTSAGSVVVIDYAKGMLAKGKDH